MSDPASRLPEILALQRAGRLAEAEALCRRVLADQPRHPQALHLAGLTAMLGGDYARAATQLEAAVTAGNTHPACLADLGTALRAAGRPAEAVDVLRRVLETSGPVPRLLTALAGALEDDGRPGEALVLLEARLAAAPDPAVHGALAELLQRIGDPAGAETHFEAALDAAPGDPRLRAGLARALAAQGRADEALGLFRALDAGGSGESRLLCDYGACLLAADEPAAAAEVLGRAVAVAPDDGRAFYLLGCARRAAGALDADFLARWLSLPGPVPALVGAATTDLILERHGSPGGARGPADDPLLRRLLTRSRVERPELETLLTDHRAALLRGDATAEVDWLCALADQCFVNEYCWLETPEETAAVARLEERLTAALAAGSEPEPKETALYATYRPLSRLYAGGAPPPAAGSPLVRTYRQQVTEPRRERALAGDLPRLTPIQDAVSRKVREQYEAHPYPRWRETPRLPGATVEAVLTGLFPWLARRGLDWPRDPRIVVAGCGTGHHAIVTAQRFAGSTVLAFDLSLASLGYACRKTGEAGLSNIRYAQADILELGEPETAFDIVESAGVLHHMADPLEGWRRLVAWVRPGGFMKIGLYSEAGRRPVVAARRFIEERGFDATPDGIRRCRRAIMALDADHPARPVAERPDFYATSTCRDLIFHVHEHRYTLPELEGMIAELGLEFLGFELASRDNARRYRERYPDDPEMRDLSRWHIFEQDEPGTFSGMYLFWLRRPA